MDNAINQQIRNHLEFLGYTIKDSDKSNNNLIFMAESTTLKPNLFIKINEDSLVNIYSRIGTWDKEVLDSVDFRNLIHKINRQAYFCKWYLDKNDKGAIITIESWFFGYDKKAFGKVIESFDLEIRKYATELGQFKHLSEEIPNG